MPPPANQGSRTVLVTWTVITAILFVAATVIAIYFYVDATKVADLAKTNHDKYADIVDDAELASPSADMTGLQNERLADSAAALGVNRSMKLLDVAIAERNALASLIAGAAATDPEKALATANTAITQSTNAIKANGGNTSGTNLADSITALATTLAARQAEATAAGASLKAAQMDAAKQKAQTDAQIADMNKTIDGIRAQQQQAVDQVSTLGATKDDQIKQLQSQSDEQVKDAQNDELKLQQQVTDAQRKIDSLQKQLDVAHDRLLALRLDPNSAILSQGDGHIVRVPGGNTVFIDLGYGDHVTPGLTFEVYDKITGIPPLGDPTNDDNLPVGKASIEITHVGATSSECRVTRTEPGTAISEGDIIANLVYDKNTKYNFVVFGNFDLAHTGKTQPQDADVIKRLITQWGGNVSPDINVNTDFVVLGAEPVIPDFTKDDLQDPVNKAKFDQATADAAAYDDVKEKAKDLRIPILNQNRFLYFVGYYDQAAK